MKWFKCRLLTWNVTGGSTKSSSSTVTLHRSRSVDTDTIVETWVGTSLTFVYICKYEIFKISITFKRLFSGFIYSTVKEYGSKTYSTINIKHKIELMLHLKYYRIAQMRKILTNPSSSNHNTYKTATHNSKRETKIMHARQKRYKMKGLFP